MKPSADGEQPGRNDDAGPEAQRKPLAKGGITRVGSV